MLDRVIITGSNLPAVLGDLEEFCRLHHLEMRAGVGQSGAVGRPRQEMPVQNLLNAFVKAGSIRGAARLLGISSGTCWRRLKEAGAI